MTIYLKLAGWVAGAVALEWTWLTLALGWGWWA